MRTHTFQVGALRCHTLEAGELRLDGGAMFGIVPRVLWERRIPADARHRIALAMRCLLIEHDDGLVLVDTGIGDKEAAKFRDIYGIANAGARGRTALDDCLLGLGFRSEDVRWVVNTHLHFDHSGGNTHLDDRGGVALAFPRARYVVQAAELAFAHAANERTAVSYERANFEPVPFEVLHGETELLPGIRCLPTLGHTPGHQSILIESKGERACYVADLVPTTAHLPLPWIMGFDVEPLVTLETKRALLQRAEAEQWLLWFEHDPRVAAGRIRRAGKGFDLVEPVERG
ncbi:MAG TPA: MBL fold metallo-hydrolase [Gemmatimonadales bacterium]|nr:MBL fold metallo-hydrolase [Gemmatimonadales bacterium]